MAIGGAMLLISVGCILWATADERRAASSVQAAIADLQASGIPVDEPTLTRFHQQLASREHTVQWLRVLEEIESPAFVRAAEGMPYLGDGAAVPLPGQPWPAQQEVESFLATYRPLLDQLHRLTQESEPVWLPIDFDEWYVHREGLLPAARLLELEHGLAVYRLDEVRVLRTLRSLLGIAAVMGGDPLIAHQLVRVSLHGKAMHALQLSLEQGLLDFGAGPAVSDLLSQLTLFADFGDSYRVAHVGDRAWMLADYRDPTRFSDSGFLNSETPAVDALVWLDFYQRSVQVSEHSDLDTFVQASERVREELAAAFSDLPDWGEVSAASSLRASLGFAKALARQVMHTRMAKLAIGLGVYQHRFGVWPDELDDLSRVGIDPAALVPLGDKPFGYRVEEGVALLWGFEPTVGHLPRNVPDDPPPLDDWDANINRSWIWRISPT